jgi:oxygen-independent coproporphyrinogen III oxidase
MLPYHSSDEICGYSTLRTGKPVLVHYSRMSAKACKKKDYEVSAPPARALYLHVPFCASKCRYCDFYSLPIDGQARPPYVAAAKAELAAHRDALAAPVDSIFVGGGTPTVLGPELLRELLSAAGEFAGQATEFSVEANPGTITPAVADAIASCGVNRVTMGAQSFHPEELAALGRIHQPADIADAVGVLRTAGIENIGLDLMFGIPLQTPTTWRDSLAEAVALGVEHLSCYGLSVEEGTPLAADCRAGRVTEMPEAVQAECYRTAISTLTQAGLEHYEISNFARPGRACLHNLTYWRNEPYLGVGPAAASYLDGVRRTNCSDLAAWMQAVEGGLTPPGHAEKLEGREAMAETAMLGLRLTQGISLQGFTDRFGLHLPDVFPAAIRRYLDSGALLLTDSHLRIHPDRLVVSDTILADLLAEA